MKINKWTGDVKLSENPSQKEIDNALLYYVNQFKEGIVLFITGVLLNILFILFKINLLILTLFIVVLGVVLALNSLINYYATKVTYGSDQSFKSFLKLSDNTNMIKNAYQLLVLLSILIFIIIIGSIAINNAGNSISKQYGNQSYAHQNLSIVSNVMNNLYGNSNGTK